MIFLAQGGFAVGLTNKYTAPVYSKLGFPPNFLSVYAPIINGVILNLISNTDIGKSLVIDIKDPETNEVMSKLDPLESIGDALIGTGLVGIGVSYFNN